MPSYKEIKAYHDEVVAEYGLHDKMVFCTEVQECIWREEASRWLMINHNIVTGEVSYHECQVLFAATGQLVEPKPCDIPGASSFKGEIFHSARWNHDVSLKGKNVVVVGNGCESSCPVSLTLQICINWMQALLLRLSLPSSIGPKI